MKLFYLTFAIIACTLLTACEKKADQSNHDHASAEKTATPIDTLKKSIPKQAHAQIGATHLMINYHAPAVRGRTIWGGLVPYGEVWVTGAHSATSLEVDKPISIGGNQIPAGKYAFFTIPGQDKWTVIINKNWDQHLADEYSEADDVVRVDVTPDFQQPNHERLKYSIVDEGNKRAAINVRWEKLSVSLPITLSE